MNISRGSLRLVAASLFCLVGLRLPAAPADEPPCQGALREVMDALVRDFNAKDVDAFMRHYSDTFTGSYPPYTKDDVRGVVDRLARTSRRMSLSYEFKEFHCAGELAVLIATERLEREPLDRTKTRTDVRERQIHFENQQGHWRILWDYELDPQAPAPQAGQEYRMSYQGFALILPPGYHYRPARMWGGQSFLVGVTDDLKKLITLGGHDLGVMIRPEQLGDVVEKRIQLFLPDCRTAAKPLREVKGLPAVSIDTECPQFEGLLWNRTALVLDKKELFAAGIDCLDESLRADAAEELNAVLAGLRRIPQESPADAAATLVEGSYRDDRIGLQIALPEGWTTCVEDQGRRITARAPSGAGTIRVLVIDLAEDVEPMSMIEKDDETTAKIVAGFSCEKRCRLQVGSLVGAQSLSRFDIGDGVKRWRAYFVRDRRAYVIVCDAQPATEFEKLEPLFRRTIESLRLVSPGQPKGPGQTEKRN